MTEPQSEGLHDIPAAQRRELWLVYKGKPVLHGWASAALCGTRSPHTDDLFELHLPFGSFP